jgi:thiamine biosynthesis protein ThiS
LISVTVNGEKRQFKDNITVEDLLNTLDIKRERLAVERNREIVPRTRYAETVLEDGDSLEIVSLVGGG